MGHEATLFLLPSRKSQVPEDAQLCLCLLQKYLNLKEPLDIWEHTIIHFVAES